MSEHSSLHINQQRLWNSLMEMAEIGATNKGGCNRQALTELDKLGRDLFVSWCISAGCEIMIDEIGNIFARRSGDAEEESAILTGSHLDTQPTGGKFDGVYGVLAGLEVIRTLNDNHISTSHPIEIVVWTNEEGARFSPACMGSGVWSGEFKLEDIYQITDNDGQSVLDELTKIEYKGLLPAKPRPAKAAIELHIEQGPILENEAKQIGVVTGIQGLRWFDLSLKGEPCHAGPTPMSSRRDPVQSMLPILACCYDLAEKFSPWGRATIGCIEAIPGSRNTVPEELKISIDLRHPDAGTLDEIDEIFRVYVDEVCKANQIEYTLEETWRMEVTQFDDLCVNTIKNATENLDYQHMEIYSGAGHDSLYVSQKVPTGMIFIPCENGLSHNEAENAKSEDLAAGANVLLHSILELAIVK
ncbi:Zn-dependent hydrolase [Aliikangiella coralliicola]|uniref:Zn-dependent hydrolase n=1 Tax=Aliikangiella coralliicola TaxID=2592383 RepID=A0A545UD79_9GAMM|nr:Zn-dependent hydrolase [Aliikangiella coralliicola]TQV87418.1 Zn-dependent hydrolase [Aliikangiella coralliicola]